MSTSLRSCRSLLGVLAFAVTLATAAATPAFAHCPGHYGGDGCHRHDCGRCEHPCGGDVFAHSFAWYADYPIYPTPYDTLCNPASSAYAPRACEAFYVYFW